VLDGVWPEQTIAAAAAAAEEIYPQPDPAGGDASAASGEEHANQYPFSRPALSDVVLHPR